MREIKFRAWDGNVMHYDTTPYAKTSEGILCVGSRGYNRPNIYEITTNIDCTAIDVMQYTGLHDKNGKEIYEGDILECKKPYNDLEIAVVRWNDKSAKFVFDMYYDGEDDIAETLDADDWISISHFEVIGNIYSNPELLEVQNV